MKNLKYRIIDSLILLLLLSGVVKLLSCSTLAHQSPSVTFSPAKNQPSPGQINESYGRLPMSFEPNRGQVDPRVRYLARGRGYQVFLTDAEVVLSLSRPQRAQRENIETALSNPQSQSPNPQSNTLRLKFDGAEPAKQVTGVNPLPGKSNYFIGNDPTAWRIGWN
jgi:hypothetical protein